MYNNLLLYLNWLIHFFWFVASVFYLFNSFFRESLSSLPTFTHDCCINSYVLLTSLCAIRVVNVPEACVGQGNKKNPRRERTGENYAGEEVSNRRSSWTES